MGAGFGVPFAGGDGCGDGGALGLLFAAAGFGFAFAFERACFNSSGVALGVFPPETSSDYVPRDRLRILVSNGSFLGLPQRSTC